MQFVVEAEFVKTGRTVRLCGPCYSMASAREWAAAHVTRDKTRVAKIVIADLFTSYRETVWCRDWDDVSNHAGLYGWRP